MKKTILAILVTVLVFFAGLNLVNAQEQPAPKKDTVNMDTDAKPEFYYAVEDEESMDGTKGGNTSTIIIIVAAVVIIGGVAVMLLRKKK